MESSQNISSINKCENKNLFKPPEEETLELVEFMVDCGADVTSGDNDAIRWAFEYGYAKILKYLHEHGADLAAITDEMIHCADANGYVGVIKYLADNGVAAAFNTNAMRQSKSRSKDII